jgi:hypothetical protein
MNCLGSHYRISFERMDELFALDDGPLAFSTQLQAEATSSSSADKKRKEEVSWTECW